jgi:hypothetical protein
MLCSQLNVLGQKGVGLENVDDALTQMELDFFIPVENQFKFSKLRTSEFFDYDTRMVARNGEMEIFIALHPDGEDDLTTYFPHLEYQRLLANLVPNDDNQEVLVIGWREQKLKDKNADWGAESYFTSRKEITHFPHTKFISFYKEGKGMVVMLYCFDKPDALPDLLKFKAETENH